MSQITGILFIQGTVLKLCLILFTRVTKASSTLCRINLKTQLWERKRNKCFAFTHENGTNVLHPHYSVLGGCLLSKFGSLSFRRFFLVIVLGKINYMTKWRQRIRKVADPKSFPSTLIQKSIVFKLFHPGERFQKVPFSWIFLSVLVWTEGVSVTIKLRFQIYPA